MLTNLYFFFLKI